jgi:hypothetical protein
MTKILARTLMLTALAGLCVASLPAATAQATPVFSLDSAPTVSGTPVTVNTGQASITINWHYNYQLPVQSIGAAFTAATLTWDGIACPPGVTLSGSFSQSIDLSKSAAGQSSSIGDKSVFTLTASPDAPGEKPLECTMNGHVEAVGQVAKASNTVNARIPFTVKYYGLLTTTIPTTIAEAGPQKEIRYDITLTNLGNANTNVNFELATEAPVGWSPVPPTPLILGPSQQAGGSDFTKTVSFLVSTPHKNGWNNDQTAFQLKIIPGSTINTDQKGNEVAVNVLARVRGIYVPGPEPFLLVAALLGTALLARTVRKTD